MAKELVYNAGKGIATCTLDDIKDYFNQQKIIMYSDSTRTTDKTLTKKEVKEKVEIIKPTVNGAMLTTTIKEINQISVTMINSVVTLHISIFLRISNTNGEIVATTLSL